MLDQSELGLEPPPAEIEILTKIFRGGKQSPSEEIVHTEMGGHTPGDTMIV